MTILTRKPTILSTTLLLICAAGCFERRPTKGESEVGVLLSGEFARLGSSFKFSSTPLVGKKVKWVMMQQDSEQSLIWLEGDLTQALLSEMRRGIGNPLLVQTNVDGFIDFQYSKAQCGVFLHCGTALGKQDYIKDPVTMISVTKSKTF